MNIINFRRNNLRTHLSRCWCCRQNRLPTRHCRSPCAMTSHAAADKEKNKQIKYCTMKAEGALYISLSYFEVGGSTDGSSRRVSGFQVDSSHRFAVFKSSTTWKHATSLHVSQIILMKYYTCTCKLLAEGKELSKLSKLESSDQMRKRESISVFLDKFRFPNDSLTFAMTLKGK